MTPDPQTLSLSLVSHTNVGKTTLARTLLNQTVGEVRDEAHVTDEATGFTLIETAVGDRLMLWDTPGFGDSARLARRLEQSDRAFGWLLSQVWDRLADRALYSSQQAVRNVRDEADVVLYLVNATENPEDSGYIAPEMKILHWIGKPILVLVNQMGPPSSPQDELAEVDRWRSFLADQPQVRSVLALDAFARCWVQEGALLNAVARVVAPDKQTAFLRLRQAWQSQRRQTFDASMTVLARRLTRAALDQEKIASDGLRGRLREVGQALGVAREREDSARQLAMRSLARRLDEDIRDTTTELIRLHGLEGKASQVVLTRLADHYATSAKLSEGRAAVFGGLVTGALTGLKADLVTGGFTLGGGMIAGGVIGALGAAGLARGYNMVRGVDAVTLSWTDEVMNQLVPAALLTYLAVAHYGRGRGQWEQSEHPAFWQNLVTETVKEQAPRFQAFWRKRRARSPEALQAAIAEELTLATERVLIRLYPEATDAIVAGGPTRASGEPTAGDVAGDASRQASRQAAGESAAQTTFRPTQEAGAGSPEPGAPGAPGAAAGSAGRAAGPIGAAASPAGAAASPAGASAAGGSSAGPERDPDAGLRHHPA